jgi:hypothetical protein
MFYASAAATPRQYEDRNMSNQQEYHPGSTYVNPVSQENALSERENLEC